MIASKPLATHFSVRGPIGYSPLGRGAHKPDVFRAVWDSDGSARLGSVAAASATSSPIPSPAILQCLRIVIGPS
jgi:hypothetical protein